jgi:hypothetical protein
MSQRTFQKILGILDDRLRFRNGLGLVWKEAISAFEARNVTDSAYVVGRGAPPVGANDWVTLLYAQINFGTERGAPLQWNLTGPLQGYPTDTTAVGSLAGDGGNAIFDGVYHIGYPRSIQQVLIVQRSPGTSGITSGELLRWRSGSFTSISILDINSITPLSSLSGAISDPVLLAGDLLLCRLRSIQNGNPANLSLQVRLGSP